MLTRAQLVRVVSNQSPALPLARAKELRRKHILWLIEHKPGASVLGEPIAVIEKSGGPLADAEAWAEADRLWREKLSSRGRAQDVFVNAMNFYRASDLVVRAQTRGGWIRRISRQPAAGGRQGRHAGAHPAGRQAGGPFRTGQSFDEEITNQTMPPARAANWPPRRTRTCWAAPRRRWTSNRSR